MFQTGVGVPCCAGARNQRRGRLARPPAAALCRWAERGPVSQRRIGPAGAGGLYLSLVTIVLIIVLNIILILFHIVSIVSTRLILCMGSLPARRHHAWPLWSRRAKARCWRQDGPLWPGADRAAGRPAAPSRRAAAAGTARQNAAAAPSPGRTAPTDEEFLTHCL
jgi:hypothetical protein